MPIRILLVKNTYDRLDSFALYFRLRKIVYGSVFYNQLSPNPDLSGYDGIVLSGTDHPPLERNLSLYANEIRLIRSTALPVLGICGGMQIICQAYGGLIARMEQPLYGRVRIRFTAGETLFDGLPDPCIMFARHLYYACRPPNGFRIIAHSWPQGVVYGLRHVTRPLFGVQFHPERRNDGYGFLDNYIRFIQTSSSKPDTAPKQRYRLSAATPIALPGSQGDQERIMR